jgi:hypothetical protein
MRSFLQLPALISRGLPVFQQLDWFGVCGVRAGFVAFMLLYAPIPLHAAPLAPEQRAEIEALLTFHAAADCRFYRNGSWYSPSEAKKHLLKKLQYLEEKDVIKNADEFINLAATASSISGKAYLVQCGQASPVASREWFSAQLVKIRGGGGDPSQSRE